MMIFHCLVYIYRLRNPLYINTLHPNNRVRFNALVSKVIKLVGVFSTFRQELLYLLPI